MTSARLYFVHALSPLHAGTGQGIGAIDLPIAREKATNIPYVPASSVKGVLRDRCAQNTALADKVVGVFGPETNNAELHAGSLVFADARLLLLPVRSLLGTFAWVTSPYLLQRFVRDAAGVAADNPPAIPNPGTLTDEPVRCLVAEGTKLAGRDGLVYLEDLDLTATQSAEVSQWAAWLGRRLWLEDNGWRTMLAERLCIVPDDLLSFLAATATETIARIRLDSATKTVADGQLWYEEALPAESILTGLAVAMPTRKVGLSEEEIFTVVEALTKDALQLGGKATVGRGLCRVCIAQ